MRTLTAINICKRRAHCMEWALIKSLAYRDQWKRSTGLFPLPNFLTEKRVSGGGFDMNLHNRACAERSPFFFSIHILNMRKIIPKSAFILSCIKIQNWKLEDLFPRWNNKRADSINLFRLEHRFEFLTQFLNPVFCPPLHTWSHLNNLIHLVLPSPKSLF